jgi:hypothetical protein
VDVVRAGKTINRTFGTMLMRLVDAKAVTAFWDVQVSTRKAKLVMVFT